MRNRTIFELEAMGITALHTYEAGNAQFFDHWISVTPDCGDDAVWRINRAMEAILRYGGNDGTHHKAWTLDQALRILAGGDYARIIQQANGGEDSQDTYDWDVGIAP